MLIVPFLRKASSNERPNSYVMLSLVLRICQVNYIIPITFMSFMNRLADWLFAVKENGGAQ